MLERPPAPAVAEVSVIRGMAYGAILVLGIASVWEDMRLSRIRNRWILCGLSVSLVGYGCLLANSLLGHWKIILWDLGTYYLPLAFYPEMAAHLGLVSFGAVLLWKLSLWPAGDAKLFIMFASLMPLADQNLIGFPRTLFLVTLINIFVPAGIFFLLKLIVERVRAYAPESTRSSLVEQIFDLSDQVRVRFWDEWKNRDAYLRIGMGTFVLFLLFNPFRSRLVSASHDVLAQVALFLGMLVFWDSLAGVFRRQATTLSSIFLIMAWFAFGLLFQWDLSGQAAGALKMLFGFTMFLMVGKTVVARHLEQSQTVEVAASQLEPGMILAEESWEQLRSKVVDPESLPGRYSDGLSSSDIGTIMGILSPPSDFKVQVCQSRAFALWIFFGTLWTLAFHKNFVQWMLGGIF